MKKVLKKTINFLNEKDIELSATEIADVWWLYSIMEKENKVLKDEKAKKKKSEAFDKTLNKDENIDNTTNRDEVSEGKDVSSLYRKETESVTEGGRSKGSHFSVPTQKHYNHFNQFATVLKILREFHNSSSAYEFDEDKTIEYIVNTGIFDIVEKPKKELKYTLYIIIEVSTSMSIWDELNHEFVSALSRFSFFKKVNVLYLKEDENKYRLFKDKECHKKSSIKIFDSFEKRNLTMLLTDCVSMGWRDNRGYKFLNKITKLTPFMIVNMLPQRMWVRTTLHKTWRVDFTHKKNWNNSTLVSAIDNSLDKDEKKIDFGEHLRIPMTTLDILPFKHWANLVSGKRNNFLNGSIFEATVFKKEKTINLPLIDTFKAEDLVNAFYSYSSPMAQKLMIYFSAVDLNMEIMKMVQRTSLPKSNHTHLAEVFLSGLLKRDKNIFDFKDGVRKILLDRLYPYKIKEIQDKNAEFIKKNIGFMNQFSALIKTPNSIGEIDIPKMSKSFAKGIDNSRGNEERSIIKNEIIIYFEKDLNVSLIDLVKYLNNICNYLTFKVGKAPFELKDKIVDFSKSYKNLSQSIQEETKYSLTSFFFTKKQYNNNYFFEGNTNFKNLMIVSFSGWNSLTTLPYSNSMAYFIAEIISLDLSSFQHQDSTGCLYDFSSHKSDIDKNMREAYICKSCYERIEDNKSEQNIKILKDIESILGVVGEASKADLDILTYNQNELTKLPPKNSNFIGRKKELEAITENLTTDNVVCVVNGIGGVGKSELSYEYLHQHKNEYNKIAFIELTEEKPLEETFYLKLQDSMQLTNDGFDTIVRRLQGYKEKNLLVLDNLQSTEDFEKVKPLNVNFNILITTRAKLNSENIINLETLNDEDAKKLFLDIYYTDENIDDILKYLDNHPLYIKEMAYSLLYQSMGAYEKAEPLFEKALRIREKVLGLDHPDTATSYNNLARLYQSMGAYEKAESLFEKALSISEKVLGDEHPHTATSYNNLGLFYKDLKRCNDAKTYLEKAINLVEKLEYKHISLLDLRRALNEVNKNIKRTTFKNKGRFCKNEKVKFNTLDNYNPKEEFFKYTDSINSFLVVLSKISNNEFLKTNIDIMIAIVHDIATLVDSSDYGYIDTLLSKVYYMGNLDIFEKEENSIFKDVKNPRNLILKELKNTKEFFMSFYEDFHSNKFGDYNEKIENISLIGNKLISYIQELDIYEFDKLLKHLNESSTILKVNEKSKYRVYESSGIVSFNYSNNNGQIIIVSDDREYTLTFSKASDTSIHYYCDAKNIDTIARIEGYSKIEDFIDNGLSNIEEYKNTSRSRTIQLDKKHLGLFTNKFGHVLIKVKSIKDDSRNDEVDEVVFEFKVLARKEFMEKDMLANLIYKYGEELDNDINVKEPIEEASRAIHNLQGTIKFLEKNREIIIDGGVDALLLENQVYKYQLENDIHQFKKSLNNHFRWMIEYSNNLNSSKNNFDDYKDDDITFLNQAYCDFYKSLLESMNNIDNSIALKNVLEDYFIAIRKEYDIEEDDNEKIIESAQSANVLLKDAIKYLEENKKHIIQDIVNLLEKSEKKYIVNLLENKKIFIESIDKHFLWMIDYMEELNNEKVNLDTLTIIESLHPVYCDFYREFSIYIEKNKKSEKLKKILKKFSNEIANNYKCN